MKTRQHFTNIRATAFATAVLTGFLFAGCTRKQSVPILAKVGDRAITLDDFRREADRQRKVKGATLDREAILQEMIQFEAQLQKARKAGFADDPQIQREIGLLLISKMRERELTARVESVQVSAEEVRAEYDRNVAKYTQPSKVRIALLELDCDGNASEAKRSELQKRLEAARAQTMANPPAASRTRAGSGFGALAVDCSDDQTSRYRGGDIGWLDAGKFDYRWPREVLEAAYKLKAGEFSEVIASDRGYFLVLKTDERASSVTTFAQVEPTIRHSLLLKKRREIQESFGQEAVKLAGVHIDRDALARAELPPTQLARNQSVKPPTLPVATEAETHH